jgi:hypothetical protein
MASRRDVLRSSAIGLGAVGIGAGIGSARPGRGSQGAAGADFIAPLTHGESENPNLERTGATGFATFTLNDDGTLGYRITAKNVENVTQAHVHGQAPKGETAGVVAFLLKFADSVSGPAGDAEDGPVDVSGTVTGENLVSAIVENPELYYVNLHTVQNPAGEIRGQLRRRG